MSAPTETTKATPTTPQIELWRRPRHYFTMKLYDDDEMPYLPKWTSQDVDRFTQQVPVEGAQLKWMRWAAKMTVKH